MTEQEERDDAFDRMIEGAQAVLDQHRPLSVSVAPRVIPSTRDSV